MITHLSPRWRTGAAAGTLTALLAGILLMGTAPAQGTTTDDADASISYVEPTDDGLQVLVSVPPDAEVDLDDVELTLDGEPAEAEAEAASGTSTVERTTILVLDTSNSMRGARFAAAQSAAEAYLDAVPEDVSVGVVTFASEVTEAISPTTDHDAVRAVVDGLELSPRTRLYDGVLTGLDVAGGDGQRTMLVLSDGADTSDTSLADVTAAVEESGVLTEVVSLDQGSAQTRQALADLAASGGGRVVDAGSDELAATFSQEAELLARQVLVTAQVPETVTATEATAQVRLGSSAGDLVAEGFVPVRTRPGEAPAAPQVAAPGSVLMLPGWAPYAAAGLVGLSLAMLLGILLAGRREPELTTVERIQQYAGGRHVAEAARDAEPLAQAREAAAQVLAANKSLEDRISARLEIAGSEFKPAEWLMLHAAIAVGGALLGVLLGGGSLLLGVLFLALGTVGPWLYLGHKRASRVKAFNAALPDTLQLMSGSLSAGMSLAQSVDTIVREANEPVATEFRRVLVEARLGVSLEDALEGVAERYDSKDFGWVVMAIRIQRQVGGNLAELLDTVAGTIREREYLRRQVSALSAEGRLSAWVLGGLPPLFFVYLLLTQGDYVRPLYTTLLGWVMLAAAALMLAAGSFWLSRLVKVEV